MLGSRKREIYSIQLLQFVDAIIVYLSFWLADILNPFVRPFFGMNQIEPLGLGAITWLLYIVVPFTPLILELMGFYRNVMRKTVAKSVGQMFRVLVVIGVCVAIMVVFFKVQPSSRLVLVIAGGIGAVLLLARDLLVRGVLRKAAKNERNKERVLIAGSKLDIKSLLETMPETVTSYWHVVDHFDISSGSEAELEAILEKHSVERVIIAAEHTIFEQISKTVELCETQGIDVWVSAGFVRTQVSRPTFDNLGGNPMLVLRRTPELSWALLLKSVIDKVFAFLLIIATSPFWVLAYIGIRVASPEAPVFFRQDRAGKYGKPFKMWKFRTMIPDAEAKLAEVKKSQGNEMTGPVFKLDKDPRVFPFAQFLRKWSIDELPQLINVLNGDMSMVGPRPLPVYEVKEFEKSAYRRRLSVKPGITCSWQAGGRNTITDWEDWVKMDLEYIDNWSLWYDFKLILMTVPAVLFSKGAK